MGKVIVKAKLTNADDITVAKRGYIAQEAIRTMEVEGILDTDAVLISLPEKIVNELGLEEVAQRTIRYANGQIAMKSIAGSLTIDINGKTAVTNCIVEPHSDTILIGHTALGNMDWIVHLQQ